MEVCAEVALWTATLWVSVYFKARYDVNIDYLAFLAPLSITLFRGLGLATIILATNAMIATTLWQLLHWAGTFSAMDLRLLISAYSIAILLLAVVVEERERSRGQVAGLTVAEAALRGSEERFRLAVKATNDAVWDFDLRSRTVTWNDTYFMLYGATEAEDTFQDWADHIHPDDRAGVVDGFWAAVDGDASSWTAQYRFRRLDQKWAYVYDRGYIARDESGVAWRVIGAMQDLTEQKHADAALRESEERFPRLEVNAYPKSGCP